MCCIDMKLVIQIILCSVTVKLAMNCGNTGSHALCNCQNRIEKYTASYKLSLISSGTTLLELSGWINCSSLCDICELLPALTDCPNMTACEDQVDAFLNSFCARVTPTTNTSTVTATQTIVSTSTFATMIERITTRTTTSTTTKTQAPTDQVTTGQHYQHQIKTQALFIALGSLLGVFVIVLTAVIIGWVWTCWTIKRRGRINITSKNKTVVTNTNEEERYFKNPIHEDTSSEENSTSSSVNNEAPQNPSATIYNTIDENEENGPAYDVLSKDKSTDSRQGQVVSNLPESEDYSRLGLCDDDIEGNYQLIDKENLGSKDKT